MRCLLGCLGDFEAYLLMVLDPLRLVIGLEHLEPELNQKPTFKVQKPTDAFDVSFRCCNLAP